MQIQQRKLLFCRRQALGERLRPRVQAVHGLVLASPHEEAHRGVVHAHVPRRTAASPAAPPAEGRHRPGTDQPARRVRRTDRARQEQRHAQKGAADAHGRAAAPRRAAGRAADRRCPGSARPGVDRGSGRPTPRSGGTENASRFRERVCVSQVSGQAVAVAAGACRLIRMPNNVHSNNRISTGRKNQPTDIGRSRRVVIREKKRGQFRTWMARVGNERLWLAFKTRTICGRAMKRRPLAFRTARARGDARP